MHLNGHSSTIYSSQDMETTQVPINRQLVLKGMVYRYNGILAIKRILPFAATWMGLENIILNEVSQTEKYYMKLEFLTWRIMDLLLGYYCLQIISGSLSCSKEELHTTKSESIHGSQRDI